MRKKIIALFLSLLFSYCFANVQWVWVGPGGGRTQVFIDENSIEFTSYRAKFILLRDDPDTKTISVDEITINKNAKEFAIGLSQEFDSNGKLIKSVNGKNFYWVDIKPNGVMESVYKKLWQ